MNEFLIGLGYHYPEDYERWKRGITEDFEASTGLFVTAENVDDALAWGKVVAQRLLNHVHRSNDLTLEQFQHECWVEKDPGSGCWSHCLDFFQHVAVGQMPKLDQMTVDAFGQWMEQNA
jgi:hypothetical protein